MKRTLISAVALSLMLAMCLAVRSQTDPDLERKIEQIFLYQAREGVSYDKKARIEALGNTEEVKAILLKMLTKHKYAFRSLESRYLAGATWILGEMKAKQAAEPLSQLLFDQKVHENIRTRVARSLGQIDPVGSKPLLLKALANTTDYFGVRVEAAEALAKTKDPQALKALERYSRAERDPVVRQKFETAAKELRARIQTAQ